MPFVQQKVVNGEVKTVLQVRALLATMFCMAIIAGFFFDKLSQDAFLPIATMCIGWFFGKQNSEDTKDSEAK